MKDVENKLSERLRRNKRWTYTGATLIIIGCLTIFIWPKLFTALIKSQRIITPEWSFYESWQKSPIPLTFNFYIFNWTNPEDIRNHSIKPRFEELGPYSFQMAKEKVEIQFNDNDTVSYKLVKRWYFDEAATNGSLDDLITTLDPISRTAAYLARNWGFFAKKGVSISLNNLSPNIAITRTVNEFLFEGFDSIIIDIARKTAFATGLQPPDLDKFGYFYTRNGSADMEGHFNVATGTGSVEMGEIQRWRYNNHTNYYPGKCGEVRGFVAGDLLPTNCKRDHLSIFSSEQGRNFITDYEKDDTIEGIVGYTYIGSSGIMDNGSLIAENKCYCIGDCSPSGSINATTMAHGLPVFMTFPHFYNADPFYIDKVEGLNPDKDKHKLFVTVEPRTGIPLDGAIRIQLNILLEPDKNIFIYRDVPRIFMPFMWLEEKATITPDMASTLKIIFNTSTAITAVGVLEAIIGLFLILFIALQPMGQYLKQTISYKEHKKIKEEVPLKDSER